MRVVRYSSEHALAMPQMLTQPGLREHPDFEAWARSRDGDDRAITLFDGDTPMVCAGIDDVREGVGEIWMFISIHASRIPKTLAIYSKRVFDAWWNSGDYIRLQGLVDADSKVGRRFDEWIGLEAEGTLRKYGPFGNDQVMYARVKDGRLE